jgi:3-oxoacyl-[acyl-carrier protein] reductase
MIGRGARTRSQMFGRTMDTGLAARTAFVCGATSGLGLAIARALTAEGARVALVSRRAELAETLAKELPGSLAIGADLTDPVQRASAVDQAVAAFGAIDVLVLNGGGPAPSSAAALSAREAATASALLVEPNVDLVHSLLPAMRERGWGRIVAIGSTGIPQPIDNLTASNLGRSALAGYLKTLAAEVARDGVTVNMVLPGRIATPRTEALDAAAAEKSGRTVEEIGSDSAARIPVGRYGRPEEFAAVVTFLASTAASYLTGEQIRCDGGLVRTH